MLRSPSRSLVRLLDRAAALVAHADTPLYDLRAAGDVLAAAGEQGRAAITRLAPGERRFAEGAFILVKCVKHTPPPKPHGRWPFSVVAYDTALALLIFKASREDRAIAAAILAAANRATRRRSQPQVPVVR